jgi:hypothetical protein
LCTSLSRLAVLKKIVEQIAQDESPELVPLFENFCNDLVNYILTAAKNYTGNTFYKKNILKRLLKHAKSKYECLDEFINLVTWNYISGLANINDTDTLAFLKNYEIIDTDYNTLVAKYFCILLDYFPQLVDKVEFDDIETKDWPILIQAGRDINIVHGQNSLFYWLGEGEIFLIKTCINLGANTNVKNEHGETFAECFKRDYQDIIDIYTALD